jgi:hypothetical protein
MLAELYRLACEEATGALECARGVVYLRRGYVRAILMKEEAARLGQLLGVSESLVARAARGGNLGRKLVEAGVATPEQVEQALRQQTELRLAALAADRSAASFDDGARPRPADVSLPFDPLPWLRRFVERRGDAPEGFGLGLPRFAGPLASAPSGAVRATVAPPARLLRRGEAGFARALTDGVDMALLPRAAQPLVQFLHSVGTLRAAAGDERRDLRRQLAELHPDKHPHASPAERARLVARFHEVAAAYRRLS